MVENVLSDNTGNVANNFKIKDIIGKIQILHLVCFNSGICLKTAIPIRVKFSMSYRHPR